MAALADITFRATHWVDARDQRLMRKVNHWRAPKWLRLWMLAATRGGDGWLWYAMAVAVALLGGERRVPALAASVSATFIGVAIFMKLKRVCGRKRPCTIEPHCWAQLLPPDQFSFPSGHTITAFAVATSLSAFYPDIQPGLYFCATSIATSRIMLGMHYLSDVVAGGFLGCMLGIASSAYFG